MGTDPRDGVRDGYLASDESTIKTTFGSGYAGSAEFWRASVERRLSMLEGKIAGVDAATTALFPDDRPEGRPRLSGARPSMARICEALGILWDTFRDPNRPTTASTEQPITRPKRRGK